MRSPTHMIQLYNPLNALHPLDTSLKLQGLTCYFNVRKSSMQEYVDGGYPKVHLTIEEPPLDPYSQDYTDREPHMLDFREKLSPMIHQNGNKTSSMR